MRIDNTKDTLADIIQKDLEAIKSMPVGSEEREHMIDDVVKLYKLKIEETKDEMDISDKQDARDSEEYVKKLQFKADLREFWGKLGLGVIEVGLPLTVYAALYTMGLDFEKTGTFTSKMFSGLINRVKTT